MERTKQDLIDRLASQPHEHWISLSMPLAVRREMREKLGFEPVITCKMNHALHNASTYIDIRSYPFLNHARLSECYRINDAAKSSEEALENLTKFILSLPSDVENFYE